MEIIEKIKNLIGVNKISKFTLYVGLNDKDSRKQEITTQKAKNIISKTLADNGIEGATFLGAEGIYTYITDNKTEKENSFKIEILFANQKQIQNAVDAIKQKLNQETIAVVKEKVASSLI